MSKREGCLNAGFPNNIAVPLDHLAKALDVVLCGHRFVKGHTLLGVSSCADEANRLFESKLGAWGPPFNFGGLAGVPFTGLDGFGAFMHHAPEVDGNILIVSCSHVGLTVSKREYIFGSMLRPNQSTPSSSCGSGVGAYNAIMDAKKKAEKKSAKHKPSSNADDNADDGDDGDENPCKKSKPDCLSFCYHAQQNYVKSVVSENICEILKREDRFQSQFAELSRVLALDIGSHMNKFIRGATPALRHDIPIAHLNGVLINSDYGLNDMFVPLSFTLDDGHGNTTDLLPQLLEEVEKAKADHCEHNH